MYGAELYSKVRMAVLRDGMSRREAARRFGIDRGTVLKMVGHAIPPGYRQDRPRARPKLDAHAGFIDDILKSDPTAPKKQRHTILRIFERLRDERGFDGGYTHRDVLVKGYADAVAISVGAEEIARHPRSYDSADFVFDPPHYLALLEMKVGALDQAAPLQGWALPDAFPTLRRLLEARLSGRNRCAAGKREYVQVLRLLETFPMAVVHGAVVDALRLGAIGYDAVKHLALCRIERRPGKLSLDAYPYLPAAAVETTSAASYMSLLAGADAGSPA